MPPRGSFPDVDCSSISTGAVSCGFRGGRAHLTCLRRWGFSQEPTSPLNNYLDLCSNKVAFLPVSFQWLCELR